MPNDADELDDLDDDDEFDDEKPETIGESECFSCGDETNHPQLCLECSETICPDCWDDHKETAHHA